MDSKTNKLDFIDSKGYFDTHRWSRGVSIEQFYNILSVLVCRMCLSSFLSSCHVFLVLAFFLFLLMTKHGDYYHAADTADELIRLMLLILLMN